MISRFCLYSILKNLRFADPFLVLFLLHAGFSFVTIGSALGVQHLIVGVLEFPLGMAADRWGRRRSLALCFLFYAASAVTMARLQPGQEGVLFAAVVLYALAEALRTGSHKAIILDYLDERGEAGRATRVIGLTRAFSKTAAAVSALGGGVFLFYSRDYSLLFWLSAGPALAGFFLMLSYPRWLDGENQRLQQQARPSGRTWKAYARALVARPGMKPLLLESAAFESQVKMILKYYVQPVLQQGLAALGIPVLGPGAIWIGSAEFASNQVGAAGALLSGRAENLLKNRGGARRWIYLAVMATAAGIGLAARNRELITGIILFVILTGLQNIRRPLFVSAFNQVMDKPQRATTLSLESMARTLTVSALLPVTGLIADRYGMAPVFWLICAVLFVGGPLTWIVSGRSGAATHVTNRRPASPRKPGR